MNRATNTDASMKLHRVLLVLCLQSWLKSALLGPLLLPQNLCELSVLFENRHNLVD
jgi:hypothetical protein